MFGVDARDSEHLDQWTQGDVVILVSLNNATHEIRLCSVYRDCAFEPVVNFKIGESVVTRAYSISSAPYEARLEKPFFEITVRKNRPYFEILETKYKGYDLNGHRGVAEGRYDGYACTPGRERVEGVNPNLKDLTMPFKDWCRLNGVELTQDVWIGPYTSFGYGYFDEIPAAYVLKYLDFQTCMNFVKVNLWTWKDGTQYIWEQLNDHLKNHARLNSEISHIERVNGKVYVTVNGNTEEYDKGSLKTS